MMLKPQDEDGRDKLGAQILMIMEQPVTVFCCISVMQEKKRLSCLSLYSAGFAVILEVNPDTGIQPNTGVEQDRARKSPDRSQIAGTGPLKTLAMLAGVSRGRVLVTYA